MTTSKRPAPSDIRAFRAANPKMREREIAAQLGVSEAALVAAECGLTSVRIDADPNRLLQRVGELGSVLALTRNESAVHEKDGVYENITQGKRSAIVLGKDIDLRIFPGAWAHAFAVNKTTPDGVRHSLQYFDRFGTAVHKIHLRDHSDLAAYQAIVADFRLDDQSQTLTEEPAGCDVATEESVDTTALRDAWSAMTDTHQFHGILRNLKIGRQQALRTIGDDYAWKLPALAVEEMMRASAAIALPIMCFVGNQGIIQIHSGPVENIKVMGPWLNVMDASFHLHLRLDHLAEIWAVRKPTADGHVTSLEALDARGEMVIQFFGKRQEGVAERPEWRTIMENLQRLDTTVAA